MTSLNRGDSPARRTLDDAHALATSVVAGDRAALDRLLESIWPDAYRIAYTILKDHAAAEDAAQDACEHVLRAIVTLRQPEQFAAWFYRIVVNESNRRHRASKRDTAMLVRCHLERPVGRVEFEDTVDVRSAVLSLATPLPLIILLHYYYGLNSNEIAEVMQVSAVTVRWRLMIARQRLRRALGERSMTAEIPRSKTRKLCG